MGSSIILESHEYGTFYLVRQLLESRAISSFTLPNEYVEVVRHQAVSIVSAVTAAGVTLVIVPHAHTVEDIDELVVVLLVFKDCLMIDASHHHVEYPGA